MKGSGGGRTNPLGGGRMMTINDLADDLIGEILSRVPITSLSVLRSTCKRWNDLSKTHVFGKKAARNQPFLGFLLLNYRVCSLRFSFQGILNKNEMFVDPSMKKICKLEDVLISKVSQCDGLLLCVTKDHSMLLVWNPYLGQTRWIQPSRNNLQYGCNSYTLGYDDNKNNRNHKILRFLYDIGKARNEQRKYQIEVYDFSSDAWRALDVNTDWEEMYYHTGVSLKGNTYFLGREIPHNEDHHLLCFDFTAEKFGPRLPLPFKPFSPISHTVKLSCIRDEKLVILYNETSERIKIWISTKIESNVIWWSMFFKVNENLFGSRSLFINEEKKVAVILCQMDCLKAYIIVKDRFVKYGVNIGEPDWDNHGCKNYLAVADSSYIPSLVQI